MRFIIEKRNYIILVLIIILCLWILYIKNNTIFLKSYEFNDKTITIIIYDKVNTKKVSNKISSIYQKYEKIKDLSKIKTDNDLENQVDKKNIILSVATNEVINCFKKNKISKYIVNADGNITTGKRYNNRKYNISINDEDNTKVLKIVSLENESMVTIHNKKYDSIVVIGDDLITTNLVAETIQNSSVEEGKKIALKYKCEVLWHYDDEITMSKNFSKHIN